MAGATMTIEEATWKSGVKRIKASWLSDDATGAVSGTTEYKYTGQLVRLVTDPGATAPDDNYDLVVNDSDSVDTLMGGGLNRDTANTEQVLGTSLGVVFDSKLTFAITNAGNAKNGTVYLYITPYRDF